MLFSADDERRTTLAPVRRTRRLGRSAGGLGSSSTIIGPVGVCLMAPELMPGWVERAAGFNPLDRAQ